MADVTGGRPPAHGSQAPAASTAGTPPRPYLGTPNAERYVIAADNLRRRQLRSALLHGSSRTWREQRRIWPGIVAGLVVVAVIAAAIAVAAAFRNERELQQRRQTSRPSPITTPQPHAAAPHPTSITFASTPEMT